MKGAIFFSGKYGSTAQYADWIGAATGLPVFSVYDNNADPSNYDFLILGSSVIKYKLTISHWLQRHLASIENRPIILFTVSGASAGAKLDDWINRSLPEGLAANIEHLALRGRLDPDSVGWWARLMLRIGAWNSTDPEVRKQELEGFDFMDKSTIEPIHEMIRRISA